MFNGETLDFPIALRPVAKLSWGFSVKLDLGILVV